MIVIDQKRIFEIIEQKRPASVAINGPDGVLNLVQDAADNITKRFGIPVYVLADTTWGTCDLNVKGAEVLAADILFNIGHTINVEQYDDRTFLIDAFDDVSFDRVARKCIDILGKKTVSLITDSQHLHEVDRVRDILQEGGVNVVIGKGGGQLNDGQVFGCEFYPAADGWRRGVEANVFLGQSNFHAAGIALSTGLPTYVLDPYFNEVREVTEFAASLQKKAVLAIYKAAEAKTFGVIAGLKEGQLSKTAALAIKRGLEERGKKVRLFALTDITNERLVNIRGHDIDAFVQTACPRISTDNRFDMPVLSMPQAKALLRVLDGETLDESYMQIPHWL